MLRGYDIDGVLVPRKVAPQEPCVIVTGRSYLRWADTARELVDLIADVPIYMNPSAGESLEGSALWKASIINSLGIDEFYEDVPEQASIIRKNTRCSVVLVG